MLKKKMEDFLYQKIIRNLMLTSKLGRQSVLGHAATGYNFDHMYKNAPEGQSLIGKLVDSILLRLPAVKATRQRKEQIIHILIEEIKSLEKRDVVPRIVDIACGAGRYLTEVCNEVAVGNIETLGIDYDTDSLILGKTLASNYNLTKESLRFVKGDAFKLKHLKQFGSKVGWKPNVILASGLIVYLDDEKVKEVFCQVHDSLDCGGLFVFSSQQNNPSKKLMEKVCKTDKGAWTLYYRMPDQLKNWLKDYGFDEVEATVDPWGMYNLLTARKNGEVG